jgi:hypothetical protein
VEGTLDGTITSLSSLTGKVTGQCSLLNEVSGQANGITSGVNQITGAVKSLAPCACAGPARQHDGDDLLTARVGRIHCTWAAPAINVYGVHTPVIPHSHSPIRSRGR